MTDPNTQSKSTAENPWKDIVPDTLVMETKDYIVYVGPKKELKWETTQAFDDKSKDDPKFDLAKRNDVLREAGVLEAHNRNEFEDDTRTEFLCLIGNAIVCSFEHDYDGAQKALIDARQFLRERSEEISRFWYLSASFVVTSGFLFFGLIIWIWHTSVEQIFGTTMLWLFLSAGAGGAGALFSVILRSGKLNVDVSAGRWLHYLEGSSRIAAGALSGIIVSLAIKAGIVFGGFAAAQSKSFIILAAMAAGCGERLATSIISSINSRAKDGGAN